MKLKAGDWVQVKSREEILATLDAQGCVDGLPFMPEMFAFCGRRLRVFKRAHKTCDSIHYQSKRRMHRTVHLEDARCSGVAHGGCQAECLLFWKVDWLHRLDGQGRIRGSKTHSPGTVPQSCSETALLTATRAGADPKTGATLYSCQATQLLQATTLLPWWDFRQYVEDWTSGNVSLLRLVQALSFAVLEKLVSLPRVGRYVLKVFNRIQKWRGGPRYVYSPGRIPAGQKTPFVALDLKPGDQVRVKSFEAVLDTIDTNYRNRGLVWSAEMVPNCGKLYRVKKRVDQIIDERTGRMIMFKCGTVILDGVVCEGRYGVCRYLCPRATYTFWRETWLEPVGQSGQNAGKERAQ